VETVPVVNLVLPDGQPDVYNGDDREKGYARMSDRANGPIPASEMSENELAFWAGIERMKADLRRAHPELFDESGELDARKAMEVIRQRAGGKTEFTAAEFDALVGGRGARAVDAS